MKDFIIIIPARLKSTRLPEKPLIEILGKSLIQRTYEQCLKAVDKDLIYVATDSEKILSHCESKGMNVLMTSSNALTGTDRVYEASKVVKAKYYINVQGDEPVFNPDDIKKIIESLNFDDSVIFNGYSEIKNEEEFSSFLIPKVVFRPNGELLYMSRAPIPGNKKGIFNSAWRQICIYAFPFDTLEKFHSETKTALESEEDIEILRFLELGYNVKMIKLSSQSISVDVAADIEKVENYLKKESPRQ